MAKIDFTKVPVKNVKGQTEEKNYQPTKRLGYGI